jgi:hypothetical protein
MEPFITAGELRTVWSSIFLVRPQSMLAKKAQPNRQCKGKPFKKQFLDVCFAWNYV